MHWLLIDDNGVFEIANGDDRTARVDASADGELSQETPVALYVRAAWPTAFPSRAVRSIPLSIPVTFPECASLAEAFIQSLVIPASCPKGGVLIGHMDGDGVEFAQAWVSSIPFTRTGVSNRFTFSLMGTNPAAVSYYCNDNGDLYTDLADDDFYSA